MASALPWSSDWCLYCRKCNSFIVGPSDLKLTLVGSTGVHLQLKENIISEVRELVDIIENPKLKDRNRTPYKALCRECKSSLGAYTNGSLSFSATSVSFRSRRDERKWKKWSEAKEILPTMGIAVETISSVARGLPAPVVDGASCGTAREPLPLVYCDVTMTSDNTIRRLTQDIPRDYQRELFKNAMQGNSLVYLPTGCGKTMVAAMAIACMSHLNPHKVAVFLAPKTPLVNQQCQYLKRQLPDLRIKCLTGESGSEPGDKGPWIELVESLANGTVDVLVLSAQIFLNFIEDRESSLRMRNVSLIVFDEAHNCTGNHPYAIIMKFYPFVPDQFKPLILALTASPASGPDMEKIKSQLEKLLRNLHCRAVIPMAASRELKTYWNRPEVRYLLKDLNQYQKYLETILEDYLKSLNPYLNRLLEISGLDSHAVQSGNYKGILRNAIADARNKRDKVQGLALAEHAMTVLSVLEVNSVLGCGEACRSLVNIFSSIEAANNPMDEERRVVVSHLPAYRKTVKAFRDLQSVSDRHVAESDRFQKLVGELRSFAERVRRGDGTCRGIVFVKMRKTCTKLCEELNKDPLIQEYLKPKRFVGHGKGTFGMEWKEEQEPALKEFHSGHCKLLVSTNVLEEGLDVPACNLVIRFDSVMSMRAMVQSRGRAARRPDSRFIIMCNDLKEKETFQGLEMKEKNIEEAISSQATIGRITVQSAEQRGCVMRKLDAKHETASKDQKFKRKKKRNRKKKKLPCVCITIHLETKNEVTVSMPSMANGATNRHSQSRPGARQPRHSTQPMSAEQISALQAAKLFEKRFNVISYNVSQPSPSHSAHHSGNSAFFCIEAHPQQSLRTNDELFDEVVRAWRARGSDGSWLQRSDKKSYTRRTVFHILPISCLAAGDFKDRGTFSELWEHDCKNMGEIIFLHDLKMVTIVFYSLSGDLQKIEFRYEQLQDFILLDVPQSPERSCDMYLCLRHVPLLSSAESFVSPLSEERAECSFSEYFLRGDSSDDELPENAEGAQGEDPPELAIESSDEDTVDSTTAESPTEVSTEEASGSENEEFLDDHETDARHEDTNPTDDEPQQQMMSFFGGETRAVDRMVWVKKWGRRYEIDENVSPFGEFLTLRIKVQYSLDLCDTLEELKSFGKRVFYAPVKRERQSSESEDITSLPPEVRYAHDCLIGLHPNVRPRLCASFYDLVRRLATSNPSDCANAIYQISSALERNYFLDPSAELSALTAGNRVKRACLSQSSVPAHCALVKRLVLTPTRVIPFPPEIMEQNRVLRSFDSENFLCVNIREEDYSRLRGHQATLDEVLKRIKGYMSDGIEVGGLLYQFLGCSNSQMRGHGCWFVHPTLHEDTTSIRQWMGDLSQIRCVASYMARLGQCFSTSMDALGVTLDEGVRWQIIDDVERGSYCFSDGIGTISSNLTKEVCRKIGKAAPRSALQIRFEGCKGVLCEDPRLPENQICIRPSMRKFSSDHRRLEILQTSRPQAVYLNHQTIMLLSNLGVPDEIFLEFQQKMLDDLAAMMLDDREALQRMSNIIRTGVNYRMLADSGVSLTTEPYFKALLCALYKERIYRLLKKSRILLPVSKSRLMMGVMDETGRLQCGQVFVQCSHMTSEGDGEDDELRAESQRFIVKERVVVTRNPCLHPGDIRVLEAVDVPELRHLVDCIVFPSRGQRPHPNEMAGGDLDGDLYFVSWSDKLKPRRDVSTPMNYPALEKKEKDGPIILDDMIDFYIEYIQSDQLGIIDNAHKVYADLKEDGVESVECRNLAEAHSLAVDAPKTGKWPVCPEPIPKTYPDFMMNPMKPSYVSQKVIGRLFRECRDFEETMDHMLPVSGIQMDTRFLHPGYDIYLESAATTYREYASQVMTLMKLYGLKSEGEMMSGCFHKLKGDFGRERTQIANVVRRLLLQLRADFRASFFKEFQRQGERLKPEQVTEEMRQKASAWYYHAYKRVLDEPWYTTSDGTESAQFVSFPWVVDDVLVTVLHGVGNQNRVSSSVTVDVTQNVARSVHEIFSRDAPALLEGYKARIELLHVVSRAINLQQPGRRFAMFGSSASLLFRPDSDLDLCVLTPPREDGSAQASQIETLQSLEPILKRALGKVQLIKNAKVPVIRLGRLRSPRASSARINLSCDISADPNGVMKTIVLVSYFNLYPWLLPLLRVIIFWAHSAGLTKKVEGFRINTNVIVFMLLSFAIQSGYIKPFSSQSIRATFQGISSYENHGIEFWERICQLITGHQAGTVSCIGNILLQFFENRQKILYGSIPECFRQLVNATTFTELLNPEDIQILREQMQKAHHVLAIHGSSSILLDVSSSQVQRMFTLSSLQSLDIAGSERSHARLLSKKSGAEVTVRPQLPGSGRNLVLEARGPIGSIRMLERVLSSETNESTRRKLSVMSKCFVRGSSMITFEGCRSDDDHVKLSPYWGHHHQTHDQRQRHVPVLDIPQNVSSTSLEECHAFQRFRQKFLDQILVVNRDYDDTIHGKLEFVVHFGRIYTFDIPNALDEDSEAMSIKDLQYSNDKGLSSRARDIIPKQMKFKKPGGSGTAKVKAVRKKKVKETKREVDKAPNHSLFTEVRRECLEGIRDYLEREGYEEQHDLQRKTYTATIHLGTKDFYASYDEKLRPTTFKLPRLRWFLADVKRPWKKRARPIATARLEGSECDVRFILGTSREFTPCEVRACDYEKFVKILEPCPTGSSQYPFKINEKLRPKLQLVRQKEVTVYTKHGTNVCISKITEYSRLKATTGQFRKVFERYEMVIEPALPASWVDNEEIKEFLERTWKLAFQLARLASLEQ